MRVEDVLAAGRPEAIKPKVFTPKVNLPILASYKSAAPDSFWRVFPSNFKYPGKSWVDPARLEALAVEHNIGGARLHQVLDDLRYGAVIGCRGIGRRPTRSTNAPSAYEFGRHVTDALAVWVQKGLVHGPVDERDLPPDAKINGIMCRLKPNGSVRIIINFSSPKGWSVNDGIMKMEFPVVMSSTSIWLRILFKTGKGSWIFKCDYSEAYKHIAVCDADLALQWIEWLGKYFVELMLVFGGVSSGGIYDRFAKLVLEVVLQVTGFPRDQVGQHLDDNFAAAPAHSSALHRFDEAFQWVAKEIGVRLAPRDDPEKSFAPCHKGVILGVEYDTVNWTWSIPKEKLDRILLTIFKMLDDEVASSKEIESIVGKLIHVRPLVPGGRFHIDALLAAQASARRRVEAEDDEPISISGRLRAQLEYWRVLLPVCSGNLPLPDPDARLPAWSLDVYTDAAGGSLLTPGQGVGAVCGDWWVYLPWSRTINGLGADDRGRRLGRKMSLLELIGPLLVVSAGASICRGTSVRVWVDNSGSVHIWRKGYCSPCPLTTTVARATHVVASGLGCRLDVAKITRCSTRGAVQADNLSKAAFHRFLGLWEGPLPDPSRVPLALLRWIRRPVPSDSLGDRILDEIL